ncbi:hypothetical protein [uncultured Parabacteroides sp.]|uniref:hypothetical protein n=1 Tax=uncultured Parabacteroides sp. TaxID=512312 RepID=UPI00262210A8|nr:hypothetical protein [uncultured Parabacteroides sp.]
MKQKINIILGFFLFSICIYGQEKPVYTIASLHALESEAITSSGNMDRPVPFSYKLTPEWKTHKKCQAWGWTTFGVGSAMMIVGFMGDFIDNWERPTPRNRFKILGFTGVAITAASVPLFAFSIKNKNKARSISMGTGTLAAPLRNGSGMAYTTGMSIGISF